MNIYDYAHKIFYSGDLKSKLIDPSVVSELNGRAQPVSLEDISPVRDRDISFSDKQLKFPKKGSLSAEKKRGIALHFFANHELLAIEMMACALLHLEHDRELEELEYLKIKRGLLTTIKDEQKHLKLYINRMKDFGVNFGDYPLNDFFWRQMAKVKSLSEYLSVIAITFEGANLDFANYYRGVFKEIGDERTSQIMDIVYRDEITHVALGAHWLNKWREDKTIWEYYVENLPELLTPSRAKGIIYDEEARLKAGLDKDFVNTLKNYRDSFIVTNRKEWNDSQ